MSASTLQVDKTATQPKTGEFVWHELRTTDLKAAEEFYSKTIGWQIKNSGNPAGLTYQLFTAGDYPAAGAMELTPDMLAAGMKPSWAGFISVDDVDRDAKRVTEAGGRVHCPPMDIPTVGRFASVEDPQGAAFLLFKPASRPPLERPSPETPGLVGWNELSANDEQSAWPFYSQMFGWVEDTAMDMGPLGIYRIFKKDGPRIGAMMTRDPKNSPVPFWLFYFNVDDIHAAVARIVENKGKVIMEPHEVPGDVWIVLALDPQGAIFAVVGSNKS